MSEIDYGARARVDYIEKQLQALFPDGYVPFEASLVTGMPTAVIDLARAGNKIAAIKEYRRITGAASMLTRSALSRCCESCRNR